ncbi:MAG: restriction endonuclease subunit S [Bacilli bacterium]|nr:restriction endonuclease subunit S [Bacilli bacterium]
MRFKEYELMEVSLNITDGTHSSVKDDSNGKYYLLSCKNIKNENVNITKNERKINYENFEKIRKRTQLDKGDSLITTVGTIGEMALIKNKFNNYDFQRSVGIIKPDIEVIKPEYLYYSLINEKRQIKTLIKGAVQKCLFINDIKKIKLKIPSLSNQDKIIKILSSLDKKIELNNQINNNLYELSNRIYNEWFVKFNYPGFKGKLKKSNIGMIPIEWKVGNIGDGILTHIIKSGITEYLNLKRYVATSDVEGKIIKSYNTVSYKEKPSRANMTPIKNSVWFAKMENSVKNILIDDYMSDIIEKYIFSTGFMGLKCKEDSLYYIWEMINSDNFLTHKNNLSTGTLMSSISNSSIVNYKYPIPSHNILKIFNDNLKNINKNIYTNIKQNQILLDLRDILLPKLMKGEINLNNIEI